MLVALISSVLLLFSLISFVGYVSGEGVMLNFEVTYCGLPLFILMLVFSGVMVVLVAGLVKALEEPKHLRAAYFLMLYPVVLGSFMFASLTEGTVPSMLFGWPLFLAGIVLVPYCALSLRRGVGVLAEGGRAMIVCYNCGEVLALTMGTAQIGCPRCGALNLNPYLGVPPLPPPPGPGAPR